MDPNYTQNQNIKPTIDDPQRNSLCFRQYSWEHIDPNYTQNQNVKPTVDDPQRNSPDEELKVSSVETQTFDEQESPQRTLKGPQSETKTIETIRIVQDSQGLELLQNLATDISTLKQERKKLSGAQRRKLKRQRTEAAGTETFLTQNTKTTMIFNNIRPVSEGRNFFYEGPAKVFRGPGPPNSYREMSSGIRLAIIPKNYPEVKITEEQAADVERKMLKAIDELEPGQNAPQFEDSRFLGSYFRVICSNLDTRHWLEQLFGDSEEFKLVEVKDLPKPVKAVVWIPGSQLQETHLIMKRLELQNQGLNTREWRLISRRNESRGQTLVFGIDEDSAKRLTEIDCKPHLNLSRVTFRIMGRRAANTNTEEEKKGTGSTDPIPGPSSQLS